MYKILTPSGLIDSKLKGKFAGYKKGKVFGTLECKSGKRMKKANRVYFHTYQDAIDCGYRPCKNCKPINDSVSSKSDTTIEEKSKKKVPIKKSKSVSVQVEFEIDMKDEWYESIFEEFKTEPELISALTELFSDMEVLVNNIPNSYRVKINGKSK